MRFVKYQQVTGGSFLIHHSLMYTKITYKKDMYKGKLNPTQSFLPVNLRERETTSTKYLKQQQSQFPFIVTILPDCEAKGRLCVKKSVYVCKNIHFFGHILTQMGML